MPEGRNRLPSVANGPRFADKPASRIVLALANGGLNIAHESTIRGVLGAEKQNPQRGHAPQQPKTLASQLPKLDANWRRPSRP